MPLFKPCSGPKSTVFLYIHVCMYICFNCIDMYVDRIFIVSWCISPARSPSNFICVLFINRWKRDDIGNVVMKEGKKVLEFVAIFRKDNKLWSIPGVSYSQLQIITLMFLTKELLSQSWMIYTEKKFMVLIMIKIWYVYC